MALLAQGFAIEHRTADAVALAPSGREVRIEDLDSAEVHGQTRRLPDEVPAPATQMH